MAVRMALGETDIVAETKRQLLQNGVNVASLESAGKKCAAPAWHFADSPQNGALADCNSV